MIVTKKTEFKTIKLNIRLRRILAVLVYSYSNAIMKNYMYNFYTNVNNEKDRVYKFYLCFVLALCSK